MESDAESHPAHSHNRAADSSKQQPSPERQRTSDVSSRDVLEAMEDLSRVKDESQSQDFAAVRSVVAVYAPPSRQNQDGQYILCIHETSHNCSIWTLRSAVRCYDLKYRCSICCAVFHEYKECTDHLDTFMCVAILSVVVVYKVQCQDCCMTVYVEGDISCLYAF